jgi:hypothetical protein
MTPKKLTPERLTFWAGPLQWSLPGHARIMRDELLGHIDALEVDMLQMIAAFEVAHTREIAALETKLAVEKKRGDNVASVMGRYAKDLADAKAEIETLRSACQRAASAFDRLCDDVSLGFVSDEAEALRDALVSERLKGGRKD